jgi:hypothetical protein
LKNNDFPKIGNLTKKIKLKTPKIPLFLVIITLIEVLFLIFPFASFALIMVLYIQIINRITPNMTTIQFIFQHNKLKKMKVFVNKLINKRYIG